MAITLGGGGGSASQIDEVVTLSSTADTVTLADGRVYLKGGTYETTLTTYPLASTSIQRTGIDFSVASQDATPNGVVWDGTNYWVVGSTTDAVYKYTSAGVYTGTSFSTAGQSISPFGIEWDGTYFWVLDYGGAVYRYNAGGAYTSVSITAVGVTGGRDIAWNGTNFFVSCANTVKVYEVTPANVTVGSFDVSAQLTAPSGISWDGTFFWVLSTPDDTAYKYNASFVYQNESFSVATEEDWPYGMDWTGDSWLVIGVQNDTVWEYKPANGVAASTSLGGRNYVRVA